MGRAHILHQVSPSSAALKATTTKKPSCAISDAQLRATVHTNDGFRSADSSSGAIRATTTVNMATPRASPHKTSTRNSADNVTAAYTLLQQAAAQNSLASRKKNESARRTTKTPTALFRAHQGTAVVSQQLDRTADQQQEGKEDHRQKSSSLSYDWSVRNIGFNDIKSEARKHVETTNREGYQRASFASCDADKPYIAEATHFRFRYPHTLGRIQALSKARSDRVSVRRGRVGASDNSKGSTKQ